MPPAALSALTQVVCRPDLLSMHKLPAAPPAGRFISRPSVAPVTRLRPGGISRSPLREPLLFEKWSRTLRVCLMADFYARAAGRGSLIAYDRASPGKNPLPEENSLFLRLSESALRLIPLRYESVFASLSPFPLLAVGAWTRTKAGRVWKGDSCPPAALTGRNALWENAGSEA